MATAREIAALERALGAKITHRSRVGGGDIAIAEEVLLSDGRVLFVKTSKGESVEMFAHEAEGLAFLRAANALRTPEVIAVNAAENEGFLALELINPARVSPSFDVDLGHGLAALHRFGAPCFGFARHNFLATIRQDNRSLSKWPAFYVSGRLEPLFASAVDRGFFGEPARADFRELQRRIDELAHTSEPPSRLHGDLWSGNVIVDSAGGPCLVDPAVYGGHREIDLAMMKLFGGFSARVFAAYQESWPLEPGSEQRVSLYQLYPLLAHVQLFGGGYVARASEALASALRG